MIPEQAIVAWRLHAPWQADAQVEQDLIISRALVAMYAAPEVADRLAFRGGTALYKLYLRPPARYSEDIDLVQLKAEPIGQTLDLLRATLDPWLGEPQRKLKDGRVNLIYRFESSDRPPLALRLKMEINSREHFSELGLVRVPFVVDSLWFRGKADIATFSLDELLGTKLRALYQRRKGRDLFDLWLALEYGQVDSERVVGCFQKYLSNEGQVVTRAIFEENLYAKSVRPDFRGDMEALLRPGLKWDFDVALQAVLRQLVARLPGEAWRGDGRVG